MAAYDLWKNFEIYKDYNGTYASEMYSLEAESIISNHDQAGTYSAALLAHCFALHDVNQKQASAKSVTSETFYFCVADSQTKISCTTTRNSPKLRICPRVDHRVRE